MPVSRVVLTLFLVAAVWAGQSLATDVAPPSIFQAGCSRRVGDEPGRVSFSTADGASRFELFSLDNSRRESQTQFARRAENGRERLAYKRVTGNFIAASTIKNGRVLYRRCNFSRAMIHCVDVRYPAAEKRAWDDIVTRISLSLRPR
jgi:hypothetical protein